MFKIFLKVIYLIVISEMAKDFHPMPLGLRIESPRMTMNLGLQKAGQLPWVIEGGLHPSGQRNTAAPV
jgi:hypothetical protein